MIHGQNGQVIQHVILKIQSEHNLNTQGKSMLSRYHRARIVSIARADNLLRVAHIRSFSE